MQSTNQAIAELKAEIGTLKALLLSKNDSRIVETKKISTTESAQTATAATSTAGQPTANAATTFIPSKPEPPVISKAEKMESTLKLIRTQVLLKSVCTKYLFFCV